MRLLKKPPYDTIDYIPLEFGMDNPLPEDLLVNIQNNMDLKQVGSALAIAIVIGVGAAIAYVLKVGDIFAIDVHSLVNVFALAVLGGVGSLISSFLTTKKGNFAGAFPVK